MCLFVRTNNPYSYDRSLTVLVFFRNNIGYRCVKKNVNVWLVKYVLKFVCKIPRRVSPREDFLDYRSWLNNEVARFLYCIKSVAIYTEVRKTILPSPLVI